MNSIRVAVVGLGKMGLVHATILNSMPNVEIVGICEKSHLLLKIVKSLFKKAKTVDDLSKLADLNLDSVYVTTPIPTHYPIIKEIFSQHIVNNVFVEKTLSSDFEKSTELFKLVENVNGVNMVGYMKRFAVTFAKAKQILAEKTLGGVVSFDAYAYSSDFSDVSASSSRSGSRGGALSDLGSHIIDLAQWFFGDLQVASASMKSLTGGLWEDEADFVTLASGLKGNFHVSWCKDEYRMPSFGFKIMGDKGLMEVDDYCVKLNLKNLEHKVWFKHDLNDHVAFLLGESEYYREDETFIHSTIAREKPEPSFKTASGVENVIDHVNKEALT